MHRQGSQRTVEHGFPGQLPDVHVLHPVVEDLGGHSAEELERVDVAVQERRQVALFNQLAVQISGVAEDHGKQVKHPDGSVRKKPLKLRPVHLGLSAGFRLKTQVGDLRSFSLQSLDIPLDDIVPAGEAHGFKVVVHPNGTEHRILFKPGFHVADKRIQFALPEAGFPGSKRFLRAQNLLFDRSAVYSEPLGDSTVGKPSFLQSDHIQCNLLAFHADTPCRRIQQVIYDRIQARSGTFSNSHFWYNLRFPITPSRSHGTIHFVLTGHRATLSNYFMRIN
jgi:hypothetical protein